MIVRNNTVLNEKHTVLTCKDKNNNLFYATFLKIFIFSECNVLKIMCFILLLFF